MNNTNESNNNLRNTIVFEPQKLKEMVSRIYDAEVRNTKTKQRTEKQMKDMIEKIIEEVANKWF